MKSLGKSEKCTGLCHATCEEWRLRESFEPSANLDGERDKHGRPLIECIPRCPLAEGSTLRPGLYKFLMAIGQHLRASQCRRRYHLADEEGKMLDFLLVALTLGLFAASVVLVLALGRLHEEVKP